MEKMLLGTAGDPRRFAARFKLSAADTWAPPVTDLGSNLIYFKLLSGRGTNCVCVCMG